MKESFLLLLFLGLLLRLLLLSGERGCKDSLDELILTGVLGLDVVRDGGGECSAGLLGKDKDGGLELCDNLMLLLKEHWVGVHHAVGDHLRDTHTSLTLIVKGTKSEREDRSLLVDLLKKVARGLQLEHVHLLKRALEHGGAKLTLTSNTLTGGHHDVDAPDVVGLESALLHALVNHGLVHDDLVTINQEAVHLVGKNTLHRAHVISLSNTLDNLRNLLILLLQQKHHPIVRKHATTQSQV